MKGLIIPRSPHRSGGSCKVLLYLHLPSTFYTMPSYRFFFFLSLRYYSGPFCIPNQIFRSHPVYSNTFRDLYSRLWKFYFGSLLFIKDWYKMPPLEIEPWRCRRTTLRFPTRPHELPDRRHVLHIFPVCVLYGYSTLVTVIVILKRNSNCTAIRNSFYTVLKACYL